MEEIGRSFDVVSMYLHLLCRKEYPLKTHVLIKNKFQDFEGKIRTEMVLDVLLHKGHIAEFVGIEGRQCGCAAGNSKRKV